MTGAALAFLCGTDLGPWDAGGLAAFHAGSPVLRYQYRKMAGWAGVEADALLRPAGDGDAPRHPVAGRLALATAMLGIHDVLAAHRIRPGVLGGVGTGALVAASLAGALPRAELVRALMAGGAGTGDRAASALAFWPARSVPDWYRGAGCEEVRFGGALGRDTSGRYRVVLLTGERSALLRLAAAAPPGAVRPGGSDRCVVHDPLAREAQARMRRLAAGLPFTAPRLPLCSALEARTLCTADEVRELFARTVVEPADLDSGVAAMQAHGVRLGLVLGPSLPRNLLRFPFPVVPVESPEDLPHAIGALLELGVEASPAAHRAPGPAGAASGRGHPG
ncbi:ACP S-malonyltransferase [Streptomyces sp. NPDC020742]|uniref:ACP S-malonyltransferase n=1 Tax=Streptomyces sp. NPDC020742 TaxID=3154897 RepID=UPI0033E3A912